jgi:predicted  nucleic acid-binding Zn-ribbon protein
MTSTSKTRKIVKTEVQALESKLLNKKSQLENLIRKLARTQYEIQKLQRSIKSTTASLKKIREAMEIEISTGEIKILYESDEPFEKESETRTLVIESLQKSAKIQRDIDFLTMFFNIEDH